MKAAVRKVVPLATVLVLAAAACGGADQATDAVSPESRTQASPSPAVEEPEGTVEAPTVDLTGGAELALVAGFIQGVTTQGGFAVKGEEITSPGPTIRVPEGEVVTITFENGHYWEDGSPFPEPHNFTVVADKSVPVAEMEPLWGAHVGGFDDPNLEAGERGSVTFTAKTAGSFYYVCAYSDHIARGLWGRFIVED